MMARMRSSLLLMLATTLLLASCKCPSEQQDAGEPDSGSGYDDGPLPPCPSEPELTSVPPPDPGPPAEAPSLDCGTPTFVPAGGLRRAPYLQSVTTTSFIVAWTTLSGGGQIRVAPSREGPWTEVVSEDEAYARSRTGDSED